VICLRDLGVRIDDDGMDEDEDDTGTAAITVYFEESDQHIG
jgi:hypothetical protein